MNTSYTMDEFYDSLELSRVAREALKHLGTDMFPGREEKVIKMRFGIAPYDDVPYEGCYTLEQVGKVIGVNKERVRQIEAKALRKLRHPDRSAILKVFLND